MKLISLLKESIKYQVQIDSEQKRHIESFVDFVSKELGIKEEIEIILQNDKNGIKTTAVYNYGGGKPSSIKVFCKDRLLVDILRSIAHEMTHHMQFETGKLDEKPADVGGPIEDEANSKAGEFIKKYAKMGNEDIYPPGVNPEDLSEQEENDDDGLTHIKILPSKEFDSTPFADYIKDERAKALFKKFNKQNIEFNYRDISGNVLITGIGPYGNNIGFLSRPEDYDFKDKNRVTVEVSLKELKYKGEKVPVGFYTEISRYLPPEEEEESYRGDPVETAITLGLEDIRKYCKYLGLELSEVKISRYF